jgi:hypothetical protein
VHFQLATLKKGNSSLTDYFHKLKTLNDTLVACGQPLNDFEAVSFLLAGLGSKFDPLVTSVTTRVDPSPVMISKGCYLPMICVSNSKWPTRISRMPLLMSLPKTLALLASMVVASMLPVAMDFQMAVATVAHSLPGVALLVAVAVHSSSTRMVQVPLNPFARFATSQATMPSPAINAFISLLSMILSLHCRPFTPLLVCPPMIVGTRIQVLLTTSLMT